MQKSQTPTEETSPEATNVDERKLAQRKKQKKSKKTFAGTGVEKRG